MNLSNRSKALLTIALTFVMIAVLLGMAEGTVRLRQWIKYGSAESLENAYEVDEKTGLRVPKAGKQTGTIAINSLGFRGPELATPKSEKQLRLAFLGASTTYCAEVSSNELTWPHLVAEALDNKFPQVDVDYVNGGVPGYSVVSSRTNLRERIATLEPDLIFIYHGTNDLSAETRELATEQGLFKEQDKPAPSWLARHSLLWNLVEKNIRVMLAQSKAEKAEAQLNFQPEDIGGSFQRNLTALVQEAKRLAPVVAIATFSSRLREEQTNEQRMQAAVSALLYMPYMTTEGLIQGFERYNAIIRQVAREQNIVLVEEEHSIPGDGVHFNDSVHFTDAGSQVMAQRVIDTLSTAPAIRALLNTKGG